MNSIVAAILGIALAASAAAQPASTSLSRPAGVAEGQFLDFGAESLNIPAAISVNSTSARTVQLLGEAMLRESGVRRLRLARDLGACRLPEALLYLRQSLDDPDPRMRAQSASAAGTIGDAAVLPALQPLLKDADPLVRRAAVSACAALGDDAAIGAGLADSALGVFSVALSAARTSEHAAAAAARLDQLPPRLGAQVLRCLGELKSQPHAKLVAKYLAPGADTQLKVRAIEALEQMGAVESAPAVLALLNDPHPTVRRAATRAIGALAGADQRGPAAIPMLEDPDPSVREAAAGVLARFPAADAVPRLVEQLDDGYQPLRLAAREALIAAGNDAVSAAAALLASADPQRQIDGSHVLGHLKSDAALNRHHALLGAPDWAVVAQAAWSLGKIGRAESAQPVGALVQRIPVLAQSLAPEQYAAFGDAATEAVVAAVRLRYRPALPVMIELMSKRGPWPRLRAACVWGFGLMGDNSDGPRCSSLLPIVHDFEETDPPKLEALKALGHLQYGPAAEELRQIAQTHGDPSLRWMAHWSYERISGQRVPYVPPERPDPAVTTIADLPE